MHLDLTDFTVVFDLDGTLVDTAPDLAAAANYVFEQIGLAPVSPAALHPFISRGSRAMIEEGLRLHEIGKPEEEVTRLHQLFLPYYEANVARFSRPFEGATEVLDVLLAAGARIAVCTNKFESLSRSLLEQLGLAPKLAGVAGRDTFAVCKPHPGHLTGTLEMVGGHVDRAVMVGDSEVDVATAIAAKVPCIGVSFGYTPRPIREFGVDAAIDHYREFLPALAKLIAAR